VLSFDATPDCRAVEDCARPGPANELLAATAAAFVRRRAREHGGQRVAVVAQWEVAVALRTLLLRGEEGGEHAHARHSLDEADVHAVGTTPGHLLTMEDVHAVGTPGVFENTAQIFEQMLRVCRELDPPPPPLPPRDCDADADGEGGASAASAASPSGDGGDDDEDGGEATSRLVLLAHPDHLRRAIRIGETTFAKAHKAAAKAAAAKAARGAPPCAAPPPPPRPPRLVPALQPYRLDWPSSEGATSTVVWWDKEEGAEEEAATGAQLDLYAGVSATVHTAGKVVHEATWRDAPNGFYPDGEPQRWAHRREVWAVYEVWARAKGVATGVIRRIP